MSQMSVNGMGFRAIERINGVHHTSIINWVKPVGELLSDGCEPDTIPLVEELDELETFVGKKNKIWRATAVNHFQPGILGWYLELVLQIFGHYGRRVGNWKCYFYITD